MQLTCLQCGHRFDGTISKDELGWHSCCPSCKGSFDVDVPEGRIIMAFTTAGIDPEDHYRFFREEMDGILSYYAFDSRKEFLEKWAEKVENPDGMWYWLIENGELITYGGLFHSDIELICDAWGIDYDPDTAHFHELLEAAYASCA